MGTVWTVLPVDEKMKIWLDELGVAYPAKASRLPTGREIKATLRMLEAYDVTINAHGIGAPWQASIAHKSGATGPWTVLNIVNYTGDELEQNLFFEKGWESLVTAILKRLRKSCGPLVLIADADGDPLVIA